MRLSTLAGAREPQAAVGADGRVYVVFGAGDTLYCAASADGGKSFGAAVRVGDAGALALGMRRGPRVAVSGKAVLVSAVYGRQGKGQDGDLISFRSFDGGQRWEKTALVNDVSGAAREGLHAMAARPGGREVVCAWLDLREKGTTIYASVSHDSGATWGGNVRVYRSPGGSVCECCHPSLAYTGDGRLIVMWRNSLGGIRDMYFAESKDGGKTFSAARKLGMGSWPLNACPMDGGMLTITPDNDFVTLWRREDDIYLCSPGKPERPLGKGQQGWIATGPKGVYAVWLKGRPGVLVALSPGDARPRPLTDAADDPVVAAALNRRGPVVVVWSGVRNSGEIHALSLTG